MTGLLLTGGGDFERYTFAGACNDPTPNNWKNACRRRVGHAGIHHTWDPRTGTNRGRHPLPFRGEHGRPIPTVETWGDSHGHMRDVPMLRGHGAYIAPRATDRLMVAAIRAREANR